jgi:membrane-bound hydrogenase subunit beta
MAVDCETLVAALKAKFADDIVRLDVREHRGGSLNEVQSRDLWIEISRTAFRPFLDFLFEYDFVDFHVISGDDVGIADAVQTQTQSQAQDQNPDGQNQEKPQEDSVLLHYHFSLFQRSRCGRMGVTLSVRVPKGDLSVPSIFDLLPGSEYSEREMHEMLGVEFVGLPNSALVFLPEDWNEEIKPWRRDGVGPALEALRELS